MIFTEKRLRMILREELERFMDISESPPDTYSIKSASGGEVIMPNYIKEGFDKGKIKSFKDVI